MRAQRTGEPIGIIVVQEVVTVVQPRIVVETAEKQAAFRIARAALAKSGTVTLELAVAGVPTVGAYRVSWLEAVVGRRLVKVWKRRCCRCSLTRHSGGARSRHFPGLMRSWKSDRRLRLSAPQTSCSTPLAVPCPHDKGIVRSPLPALAVCRTQDAGQARSRLHHLRREIGT